MGLWSESAAAGPFGASRKGPGHLQAVETVKQWTRERFALGEDDTVMVTEIARALPGVPPLETVVGFWTADGTRHHFRVFKPVEEVVLDDVPPAWLKEALAAAGGIDCSCC